MQKLNVHFVNRGYDTCEGVRLVEMVSLAICEFTGLPQAKVKSPFSLGGTLTANFETVGSGGWVCDLD